MDLDNCGVIPAVDVPELARLAGWVVLAEALAEISGVDAICGLCAVTWLVVAGGCLLLLALVAVGECQLPPMGFARVRGLAGWSPWERPGAR